MSDVINEAVTQLNAKMGGNGFDGTAKFVIEDEGDHHRPDRRTRRR